MLGIGYMRTWSIVQSTFSNGRKFFFNWVIYIYDWSAQRAQQRIPWFFFRLRIAASFVCLVIILVIWSIFKHVRLSYQLPNWWAPWNLSCLEFKFDDTRLSYWHKNKIGRIEKKICCFLTLLILCPVSCLSKTEQANRAEN